MNHYLLVSAAWVGLAFPLTAQPAKPEATANNAIVITAESFEYDAKSGVAIYSGDVHAEDPQMDIRCGVLTARFAASGSEIETITAEKSVTIVNKGDQTRGKGDKAVYTAATDVLELTGNPSLETAQGELTADSVVLDRREGKLRAKGSFKMKLKPDALRRPGPLAPKTQ
jgi:lipopolysaccharide transport protein LptA